MIGFSGSSRQIHAEGSRFSAWTSCGIASRAARPCSCRLALAAYTSLVTAPLTILRCVVFLQVASPLTSLTALPQLRFVDMRGVHDEQSPYWGAAKCETMRHLATLSKALRRRRPGARVVMDLQ